MYYKWLLIMISIILIGILISLFVMMNTKESFNDFYYDGEFNGNSKRKRSCGNYYIKSYNTI
jgi:hypothetical protein